MRRSRTRGVTGFALAALAAIAVLAPATTSASVVATGSRPRMYEFSIN